MRALWELIFSAEHGSEEFLDTPGATIVIDSYENLGDMGPAVDDSILSSAARHPHSKFILSGRSTSSLADPRHQMRGTLQLIGPSELALTHDEVHRLVAEELPEAPTAVASSIYRDTSGLPLSVAAMIMALSSLNRIPSDHGVEWRTLVSSELSAEFSDPALLRFLQVTSTAPYFDTTLAQKLSKFHDVSDFISELEHLGFGSWNPHVHTRPVFQYVESLRLMFAAEFKSAHPKQFLRANSVTAKWFRANSDYEQALTFAVRAKNYELAAQATTALFLTSPESYMSDLLVHQLRAVPLKALKSYPILAFSLGLAYSNNPLMAESATRLLEAAADSFLKPRLDESLSNKFVVNTMRAVALRQVGRYSDSAEMALTALSTLDIMAPEARDELHEYLVLALRHVSYCLFQGGKLEEAVPVINAAVAHATSQPALNYTLSFAAGIHAFMGATASAQQAIEMSDPLGWPRKHDESYLNVLGVAGRAMLLIDRCDYEAAELLLARSEHFCSGTEFWPFSTTAMMHTRLALGHGLREAQRVADLLSPLGRSLGAQNAGIGDNLGTAAMHNMLSILWLSAGQPARAATALSGYAPGHHQVAPARMLLLLLTGKATEAAIEYSAAVMAPGSNPRTRAALHLLGAVASLHLGSEANALKLLRKATIVYQATGIRAHILFLPQEDRAVLLRLAESSGDKDIVDMFALEFPAPLQHLQLPPALSPREKVVLQQLVQHRSVDDISGALFVSSNTVKSQLRSIYRKLQVSSRDDAIAKALEMDLLN
ncbi:hypothetical protein CVS30_15175 [Arthrobacter psychrolactophilus]|uniref:HTH luxR-type domain-containing protein n=1 Tax=Arthrobacter psychrolactophilus TaxID=92442 RepID=A0A2V5ITE5_9MICC|nr:LuxR C-terminal-related transcriptional regulator [Arthrobacter psychrolactophilus]PYI37484.1 hypothetical protein CVS30_15175 [Arthrobacter psychrolactophilus]